MLDQKAELHSLNAYRIAVWLVVCTGIALRCLGLTRGLWFDEAWVLDSIRSASLHEMFYYRDWAQTMPPGVLLVLRAVRALAGAVPEHMRVVPLLCGCVTLALLASLFRRVLAPPFALLATLMVALSPEVIWYATEVKQYVFDLLAATLVLWQGVRYIERPSRRALWRWFALYGLACLFSYTLVFFLPAMALAALLAATEPNIWTRLSRVWWPTLLAAALSVAVQLVFAQPNTGLATLRAYWLDGYVTTAGTSFAYFLRRVFDELYAFLPIDASTREVVAVLLVMSALGVMQCVRCASRQGFAAWALPALLVVPQFAVLAANALEAYPVSEFRMLYFLIAPAALLLMAGLSATTGLLLAAPRRAQAEVLLCVVLAGVTVVGVNLKHVHTVHGLKQWQSRLDMPSLVSYLHRVDGLARPIYVQASLRQLLTEYARQYPLTVRRVDGDVGWPCCVPGKPWQRPEFTRADIEREMARVLPKLGAGVSYLLLRKNGDKGEGREQHLYKMAAVAHGCAVPWGLQAKGLELVKIDCPRLADPH